MSLLADSVDFYLFIYLFIAYSATEVQPKHFKETDYITVVFALHYSLRNNKKQTNKTQLQNTCKVEKCVLFC